MRQKKVSVLDRSVCCTMVLQGPIRYVTFRLFLRASGDSRAGLSPRQSLCLVKVTTGELQALSLVCFTDELAISAAAKRLLAAAQYRGRTERYGRSIRNGTE